MLRIVVDSSATLTRDEAARLGVTMVPMTYTVDGTMRAEGFMGENGDVAALLADGRVTATEGVRTEAFAAALHPAVEAGDDVLCVTISSKLSNTYRHAMEAAPAQTDGMRIAVLDSLSGISGIEQLVTRARALDAGGASFDEVVDGVRAARAEQGISFTVPNTDALRATGRMALVPQSVGSMLNRRPILTLENGNIRHVDTARGTQATAAAIVACVPRDAPRDLVITGYGEQGPLNVALLHAARAQFPQARIRIKEGGPVLSFILGSGAVSITWGPQE